MRAPGDLWNPPKRTGTSIRLDVYIRIYYGAHDMSCSETACLAFAGSPQLARLPELMAESRLTLPRMEQAILVPYLRQVGLARCG